MHRRPSCPSTASLREREGPAAKRWEGEGACGKHGRRCFRGDVRRKIRCMPSETARVLRRASTDAERRLWAALRGRRLDGFKFRRQRPIGRFVVDFVCMEHRLVIEADGGQHADSEADAERTEWLEAEAWRVLRFWNNEVLANTEGVLDRIPEVLRGLVAPHPPAARAPPSPAARERGNGD